MPARPPAKSDAVRAQPFGARARETSTPLQFARRGNSSRGCPRLLPDPAWRHSPSLAFATLQPGPGPPPHPLSTASSPSPASPVLVSPHLALRHSGLPSPQHRLFSKRELYNVAHEPGCSLILAAPGRHLSRSSAPLTVCAWSLSCAAACLHKCHSHRTVLRRVRTPWKSAGPLVDSFLQTQLASASNAMPCSGFWQQAQPCSGSGLAVAARDRQRCRGAVAKAPPRGEQLVRHVHKST